jgi:exodeoxyribonuclease VII small subunit
MNARKSAAPAAPAADVPFEEAIERLEQVVEELEGGSLSLEESLARYEEGVRLSRRLTQTLDSAEKRIEKLIAGEGDESPRTAPIDDDLASPDTGSEIGRAHV